MNIAVIGAGIGGLAISAFLARAGHSVTVLESFPEPRPVGAGLLLQPPGQAVLQHLGILEPVAAASSTISRLQSLTHTGRTLLDVRYAHLAPPARHGLGVRRAILHGTLLNCSRHAGVKHLHGIQVSGTEADATGEWVLSGDGRHGPYDLVIIATGARSDWLGADSGRRRARRYPWGCLWATLPLPATLDPAVLHQRCLGGRFMAGLLPTGAGADGQTTAAFYWSVRHDRPLPALDEIRAWFSHYWPEAAIALQGISDTDLSVAVYYDVWARKPVVGRTVMIGDVAHGTSPQLGQGCTSALLDAYRLASCLAELSTPVDTALATYRKHRAGHQRYIRYASIGLTPVFQTDNRLIAGMRDFALGALSGLPGARALAARSLASDVCLKEEKAPSAPSGS